MTTERETTVRSLLEDEHIVAFDTTGDGQILVTEKCDGWYHAIISPADLRELAAELLTLADEVEAEPREEG